MRLSANSLETIAEIARDAAVTEIMPRFRNLGEGGVRQKTSPTDVVTDADEAAERRIAEGLQKAFPGSGLIGEEASEQDPGLLDRLGDGDLTFIVDPVDGTLNFAAGVPLFGTMIAATVRGEVVAGLIHDPVGGDTFMALRGEGAWRIAADGSREDLRVARPEALARMRGAVCWHLMDEPLRSAIAARIPRVALGLCYHCAAHEYRLVTAGHVHFLLYGTLKPWDHAPGWLMHREAGGHSAHFDGSPYRPSRLSGGLICAPDQHAWQELREALVPEGPLPARVGA